jgi:hypothetical protein
MEYISILSLLPLILIGIKVEVVFRHGIAALNLINESETIDERIELSGFYKEEDIEAAYRYRFLINPFRWSFAATFPRLHNEVKRRKEIAEL